MTETIEKKKRLLYEQLAGMKKAVVAYSGGVDSTLLLKAAKEVLGKNVIAVTAGIQSLSKKDLEMAKRFCEEEGILHIILTVDALAAAEFRENHKRRCYYCKKNIFSHILQTAEQYGISHVLEGSNMDDESDYRPGREAILELGIERPLYAAGFYKREIRSWSKELELPTWNLPSCACLASRIAYGEEITKEKLSMVEKGESLLAESGFYQYRVRIHDKLARIEILPEEFSKILEPEIRKGIVNAFRKIGFQYITFDLEGFRSGSMNEMLSEEKE